MTRNPVHPATRTFFSFLACSLALGGATTGYPEPPDRSPSKGGITYHIDPVRGDDANAGLTHGEPWKTFHPVNRMLLAPGDRVEVNPGRFDHTLSLAGGGTMERPAEIRFAAGRYDFDPANARREAYQISNTNDDPQGLKAVGLHIKGAKHLRITGPGAVILARGKMIHVCIDDSEDVTIGGLAFDYHRPTVSEFRVAASGDGFVDLAIHRDSPYTISGGKITWQGEGWSHTTGLAQELDPETHELRRRRDPLAGLVLEELEPFVVRARGSTGMKPGRIYQIRDTRRDCAGVFTRRSRGITWKDVRFRFLHGMGLVHQFSENLTFDSVVIAPDESGGRTTAAWADCLHFSGCKGRILVKDTVFSGAHDDAINIHGTYLRIIGRISDRMIRVRFMHPQTFGFMAFNPGDEVGFVHSGSMASYHSNRVREARMDDPRELLLTLERPVPDELAENDVIENVTWTPAVEIRGCKVMHIPTRGFLITTPRTVLVEDNEFLATHMSAIQVDADTRSWFESGAVRDMTIRGNRFIRCGEPVIHINPRNSVPNSAVHRNIRIVDNTFDLRNKLAIGAKSTAGLRITGNRILADEPLANNAWLLTTDCADVVVDDNPSRARGTGPSGG
ncbi:MAG: right-handed parallel beta-helix repeat-containing protein [Akkermansiaceae bacterium]|nr:right-handed parallel beta-helix repeat-containing protein [Akkermansiaceae bacterium]